MDFGFNGKKAYIYGLGASGRATAKVLMEACVKVVAWDDKVAEDEKELTLLEPDKVNWREIGGLVKTPGIAMDAPLVKAAQVNGVPVIGDVDLLARRETVNKVEFIGITGTNGKSTTTALVGHVLRKAGKKVAVGGNIGHPALSLPELPEGGIYVLEFSSYQLEMLRELAVDGAIFLNLTPDHLERHKTMENYLAVKLKLFELAKKGAVKVVGVDQPILREKAWDAMTRVSGMHTEAEVYVKDSAVWRGEDRVLELRDFPHLPGPHNAQNIACAFALLVPRWMDKETFVSGAKSFMGLPHRLEAIGEMDGVRFINDSKATNGDSAVYALQSYEHIYWICGGQPKSDGLGACVEHLGAVRAAFTIGQSGEDFAKELAARNVEVFKCKTLEKAVPEAFFAARSEGLAGAVVLLSPAAASMDQFKNFEHRGDVFANCVRELKEKAR